MNILILGVLCLVALFIRFPLISAGTPFYSADTAILDLMARHFMKGEWAFFYWGEHYYGVLDPVLLAPLFKIFGYSPLVSQMVPYAFTVTFLILYHRYLHLTAGPWMAHLASAILAVGTPFFLQVTFNTYNYILALNFGIAFWLLWRRLREGHAGPLFIFLFGALAGFSLYYFRLVLNFWLAAFASAAAPYFPRNRRGAAEWGKAVLAALRPGVRSLVGWINLGNAVNFLLALFLFFHGDWIGDVRGHTVKFFYSPIMSSSVQLAALSLLLYYRRQIAGWWPGFWRAFAYKPAIAGFLLGFSPAILAALAGCTPSATGNYQTLADIGGNFQMLATRIVPWMAGGGLAPKAAWYSAALLACGAAAIVMRIYKQVKAWRAGGALELHPFLWLFMVSFLVSLFGLRLGNYGTGRYWLPFFICLPYGMAMLLQKIGSRLPWAAALVLGIFLTVNFQAERGLMASAPQPAPHAALTSGLVDRHYKGGYADYWLAYQITALSGEALILAPTGDNDRYKPYLEYVRTLKDPILVGEEARPKGSRIDLKGTGYRVIGSEELEGATVTRLEKIL